MTDSSEIKKDLPADKKALPLFADVFYGVLMAPRPTFAILSDSAKFPPTAGNLFLTTAAIVIALAMPAGIKAGLAGAAGEGAIKAILFIISSLVNWTLLSFILFYISIWMRECKLTLGNAFIATGWAFLPFAFFAPVACFKNLLGGSFIYLACLPSLWFLTLQWLAFQAALRTSTAKIAMIAIVVPPLFCLIYLFWIILALFLILSQIISHLA